MKTVTVNDVMTGKSLLVILDVEADTMTINGVEVERQRPLEDKDDVFVYGPKGHSGPLAPEIYHVKKEDIA